MIGTFHACVLNESASNQKIQGYDNIDAIGNRFRCYPTPTQEQTLLQWIGCQRHIYNAKVREDQYFRRFARKSLTHTGQYGPIDQQYRQFKTGLALWLFEVRGHLLRNGAVLWKQAYSRYFSKLAGRRHTLSTANNQCG